MPWSGGSYNKGNNATGGWVGDASLGIGIEAGRHDTQDNDFATGINQCINKDGSNSFTGNPNLGGFIPTNLGAGTAAAPAVCVGNDVNTGVFGPAADTWAVATNGTERMRITSAGKVGIGTTAPYASLDVASSIQIGASGTASNNFHLTAEGSGLQFWSGNYGFGTERMRIDSSGNVGIGGSPLATSRVAVVGETSNNTRNAFSAINSGLADLFYVRCDGLINTGLQATSPYNLTTGSAANVFVDANGTLFRSTSSARYKTDIEPYTGGLSDVLALAPKFYKGINDGDIQFAGLIAEDVHDAGLTEFVVYNDKGEPDALAYSNMVALAFKAIQELNTKVETLEARVAALEEA